jgi:hypothetical protein
MSLRKADHARIIELETAREVRLLSTVEFNEHDRLITRREREARNKVSKVSLTSAELTALINAVEFYREEFSASDVPAAMLSAFTKLSA